MRRLGRGCWLTCDRRECRINGSFNEVQSRQREPLTLSLFLPLNTKKDAEPRNSQDKKHDNTSSQERNCHFLNDKTG